MSRRSRTKYQSPSSLTTRAAEPSVQDYEKLFFGTQNASYMAGRQGYLFAGTAATGTSGLADYRVPPAILAYVVQDPVIYGMIRTIIATIFRHDWSFLGGRNKAKQYTDTLKTLDWDAVAPKIIHTWIGSAGGNGLLYFEKQNQYITIGSRRYHPMKLKLEPFLSEGRVRVKIFPDYNRREITKYSVVDSNDSSIRDFTLDEVIHVRYMDADGDFRFSTSPAIVAARAANLKFEAMVASESVFSNGMNFNKFISPDFKDAKDMDMYKAMWSNWSQFTTLLGQTNGLYNRNKDLVSQVPAKIEKIGVNNLDMQTIQLKQECDKELQAAYGVALSNLGFTESANYSTSEQNRDNISELNTNWLVKKLEKLVMREIMPRLFEDYDEIANPFVQSYDPSSEDLEIRQQNFQIIDSMAKVNKVMGSFLDVDDSILDSLGLKRMEKSVQAELPVIKTDTTQTDDTPNDIAQDTVKPETPTRAASIKAITFADHALVSPKGVAFTKRWGKALTAQLENAAEIIRKSDINSLQTGAWKLKPVETFYTFRELKKDIAVFARIGVTDVQAWKKAHDRAVDDTEVYLEEYVDEETTYILKGSGDYGGVDVATKTMLQNIIDAGLALGSATLADTLLSQIPALVASRAALIATSEISKAIEQTRATLYSRLLPDGTKSWQSSAVSCPICIANTAEGEISMRQSFGSGADFPPAHPGCACSAIYS